MQNRASKTQESQIRQRSILTHILYIKGLDNLSEKNKFVGFCQLQFHGIGNVNLIFFLAFLLACKRKYSNARFHLLLLLSSFCPFAVLSFAKVALGIIGYRLLGYITCDHV